MLPLYHNHGSQTTVIQSLGVQLWESYRKIVKYFHRYGFGILSLARFSLFCRRVSSSHFYLSMGTVFFQLLQLYSSLVTISRDLWEPDRPLSQSIGLADEELDEMSEKLTGTDYTMRWVSSRKNTNRFEISANVALITLVSQKAGIARDTRQRQTCSICGCQEDSKGSPVGRH